MKDFIENQDFLKILAQAEALKKSGKRFSDIEDGQGNQYVDLVQEGGGVLGIALVGYTYVLEAAGIRFFSLAGTSAGAINTMMIAGLGPMQEAKSEKILDILSRKSLFDLVDGDKAVRSIIQKAVRGEKGIGLRVLFNARTLYKTIMDKFGLNPGSNFETWITEELAKAGVKTMADIKKLMGKLPAKMKNVRDGNIDKLVPKLAIIAADVTTHSKIEFPEMTELFFKDPEKVSPAKMVRTSMSIPLFFEPVTFDSIPNSGTKNDANWMTHCRYAGEVPSKVTFVDGGMLSNFPINVFHRSDGGVPRWPTFGAKLSTYRESYSKLNSLTNFFGSMISSMRQIHDYDFLKRNPDYNKLICHIDADKEFNWLDFEISRSEQVRMFLHGAKEGLEFLDCFDWEGYREVRAKLSRI
ncbi:MAG: patatin-like phospholipase family protein [Bacteroidales bacterium]|nr:patatin-like phospholipase family protein [Bacteroidales bacterium]